MNKDINYCSRCGKVLKKTAYDKIANFLINKIKKEREENNRVAILVTHYYAPLCLYFFDCDKKSFPLTPYSMEFKLQQVKLEEFTAGYDFPSTDVTERSEIIIRVERPLIMSKYKNDIRIFMWSGRIVDEKRIP